jgi:hypothetical protein
MGNVEAFAWTLILALKPEVRSPPDTQAGGQVPPKQRSACYASESTKS